MATSDNLGTEVSIGHYDFITLFIACRVPKGEEAEKQQQQADRLNQVCRNFVGDGFDLFFPDSGELVGVFLPDKGPNGAWVRGRVEECIFNTQGPQYKVLLVDQGCYIKSKRRHLVQLNEPIRRIPPAFKRIGLFGVLPEATLNQNTKLFLTDFFHKGRVFFKRKLKIDSILFGDISVKQDCDGQVLSLAAQLLGMKLVKKVDNNFEAEAKKFYKTVEGMEKVEEASCITPPNKSEIEEEEVLQRCVKTQRDRSINQSKDTGYSSSDDCSTDIPPYVNKKAIFVPAGHHEPQEKKKTSKNKKEEVEPIKTYMDYYIEREKSKKKEKRIKQPKEDSRLKNQEKLTQIEKQSFSEDKMSRIYEEEEILDIYKPSKVMIFEVKSKETKNLSEDERYVKAFNLNYKSKAECTETVTEEKPTINYSEGEFGKKKDGESRDEIGKNFESAHCSINSFDISCANSSFESISSCANEGKTPNISFSGSEKSILTKKQLISQRLKAGIAAREIIERYSGENVGEKYNAVENSSESFETVVTSQNSTFTSHDPPHQSKMKSNSSICSVKGDDLKCLDSEDKTNISKCLSIQEKRKLIQEKLKKEKEAQMVSPIETCQRDMSSCSLSECSDDCSISSSKLSGKPTVKPTLESLITVPIEELEDDREYIDYVDPSETKTFLRGIITTTGVLIHTKDDRIVRPNFSLVECCLDKNIMQSLEKRGKREMNRIQKFAYPIILARKNIAMISPPRSGKTCGYVVPIASNLLNYDYYDKLNLPMGNGPRAVVVAPCWESGAFAAYEFKQCSPSNTVIHCYGGGAELELKVELLQGCDVLVTTPRCLLRLLACGLTDFTRLCHLVLDDADVLYDKFLPEMKKLMVAVDVSEEERLRRGLRVRLQVVLAARKWTPPVTELATCILADPTICIASQLEACVYAGIKPTAVIVQNEKKIEKLVDVLKEVEGRKRIVVMCRTKEDVKQVHSVLIDLGVKNVIAAHEDLSSVSLSEVPGFWIKDVGEKIWDCQNLPIMVRSDDVLEEVPITNADMLIHYNMSSSKKTFSLRFISIMEKYHNVLKKEAPKQKPQVVILLDEKNDLEVPGVMEFMERLGTVLPEPVRKTLEKIEKLKDESRMSEPLCEDVKAFGRCWDVKSCPSRHLVTSELDFPDNVPRTGWVKIIVQHVHDACHFSVRLLEHAEVKDKWKRLPSNLSVLPMKLNNYFAKEGNKRLHGHPKVGDIVALETSRGVYQRAVVLKITDYNKHGEPTRVGVRLMDNGRYDSASVAYMWRLPAELAAPPAAVVDVYLCGLRPRDLDVSWPPAPGVWVDQQLHDVRRRSPDGYLRGKIVFALRGSLWLEPVEYLEYLPNMETTVYLLDLRKDLLAADNATENPDHIPALRRLCQRAGLDLPPEETPKPKKPRRPQPQWAWLPQDRCENVHIIVVQDPDTIFLRLNYFADCLEKLVREIQKYANGVVKTCDSSMLDVGDVCLGRTSGSDEWNRALVKSKPDKDRVELFFADYGDTDVVPWTQVKTISNKLITQLPFQAIECYLAGVKFVAPESGDKEWEDDVVDMIYNLSRDASEQALSLTVKVCEVEAKATCTNGKRYQVVLANCFVQPVVILNSELVQSQYVKLMDEDVLTEPINPPVIATEPNSECEDEMPSTSSEVVPFQPESTIALPNGDANAEERNMERVERFLKDLEEGDFDISIFHEIENDADVSDNTSEGSVLSLPRPSNSLPGTSSSHLPLPPPETEDSLSITSNTISSSRHSSTLSLCQETNKSETRDNPFRTNVESLRFCGPSASSSPLQNKIEEHVMSVSPASTPVTGKVQDSSSGPKKVTGIVNNFRDLISPSFLSSRSASSSPLNLVEKVSPFLKRVSPTTLQESSVCDDLDELDNTMYETGANLNPVVDAMSEKDAEDSVSKTVVNTIVDQTKELQDSICVNDLNPVVDAKSEKIADDSVPKIIVNPVVEPPKEVQNSKCVNDGNLNLSDEYSSKITSQLNEHKPALQTIEKEKSPCQKWVESVVPESDEDLSMISQDSIAEATENNNTEVRTPLVEWHQDDNFVVLQIKLPALAEYEFTSDITSVHFSTVYGGIPYKVDLPELFGGHKQEKACGIPKACYFEIRLEKLLKGRRRHWPRLTKRDERLHWLKLNAEKACEGLADSDDEDVKRLACQLPLWNDNPTETNSVASSDRSELANSELSLF